MRRKNVVWGPRGTGGGFVFLGAQGSNPSGIYAPNDVYPSREVKKWVPPKQVVVTGYLSSTIFSTSMIMGEKGNQTKLPVFFTL